jgi:hypothetical protein
MTVANLRKMRKARHLRGRRSTKETSITQPRHRLRHVVYRQDVGGFRAKERLHVACHSRGGGEAITPEVV